MARYICCDLGDAVSLIQRSRGDCTQNAMRVALELSRLSYDMDIAPCLDAGWEDISFQVDDLLFTGLHGRDAKARKVCLQAAAKACGRMEKLNPFSQIKGFKRQRAAPDTCKAMVMAKQVNAERTMVVLAFTGTTRRLYEWLGNFRMQEEDGFHSGFLLLTKQFEENADRILFPQTAQRLGLERLSLADILQHMRQGGEQFHLFVTGHSQGAALMQVYIHRLIASGVPPMRVLGVGFASPTVVHERAMLWTAYPIRHFINADDIIARVGSRMHIGKCSVLPASQIYRAACYGPKINTQAMRDIMNFMHGLRNTEEALLFGMAVTEALCALRESVTEEALAAATRGLLPDMLRQRLTGYTRRMLHALGRRTAFLCERVAGQVDQNKLQELISRIENLFLLYGARETIWLLAEGVMRPHALAETDGSRAYQLLAEEYDRRLQGALWGDSAMPVWDLRFGGERWGRLRKKQYDRFHPLSGQKQHNKKRGK